jgi:hypothetical protein
MTPDKREHALKPARVRESFDVPTELGRLIDEALRCLEGTDLHGANAALAEACAEAASSSDAAGLPRHFGADNGPVQRSQQAGKEFEGWE